MKEPYGEGVANYAEVESCGGGSSSIALAADGNIPIPSAGGAGGNPGASTLSAGLHAGLIQMPPLAGFSFRGYAQSKLFRASRLHACQRLIIALAWRLLPFLLGLRGLGWRCGLRA